MRQFTLSTVAATAFCGSVVSVPAQADSLNGAAPKMEVNASNFRPTAGSRDSRGGATERLSETASATVAPAPRQGSSASLLVALTGLPHPAHASSCDFDMRWSF